MTDKVYYKDGYYLREVEIDNYSKDEVEHASYDPTTHFVFVYCRHVDRALNDKWYRDNKYFTHLPFSDLLEEDTIQVVHKNNNLISIQARLKNKNKRHLRIW